MNLWPSIGSLVKLDMRIAVDLDGVLPDTMTTFCDLLNKRHETRFTTKSFTQWNAWEIAEITEEEFFRTLDEAWFRWQSIPPTEDHLAERVAQVRNLGKLDIVTGRSERTVQYAIDWLQKHNIHYDEFVRTVSTRAKAKLDYDIFVDDSADLMSLIASRLDSNGILYSQPWNKKAPAMPRISRVERWEEIPSIMRRLAELR